MTERKEDKKGSTVLHCKAARLVFIFLFSFFRSVGGADYRGTWLCMHIHYRFFFLAGCEGDHVVLPAVVIPLYSFSFLFLLSFFLASSVFFFSSPICHFRHSIHPLHRLCSVCNACMVGWLLAGMPTTQMFPCLLSFLTYFFSLHLC
jgi:hypothetical protein